ncbi:MAG: hypothetical protein M3N54_14070, partial [Acidobacteriota bacterium]|nr:hypothetical protein [Acidobacteriota bacterium]
GNFLEDLNFASAHADYLDSITVNGTTAGLIRFTFVESGESILEPGGGSCCNAGTLTVNGSVVARLTLSNNPLNFPPMITVSTSVDIGFAPGIPVSFGADLLLGTGFLDFSSNAIDQNLFIQLLDTSGQPLSGASFTTEWRCLQHTRGRYNGSHAARPYAPYRVGEPR